MSKWINVKDRMPECQACVLVFFDKDSEVEIGYWRPGKCRWELMTGGIEEVTHWMPLPEPPELTEEKP